MNQELRIMNHGKLKTIIPNSLFIIHLRRGFTLIELLVVIAVVGIVSVAILAGINVTGKLNQANLANAKTFAASLENSLAINQVGKWSFEENSSPSKDTSGYGNDGTWTGGITWQDANTCGLGFGGCLKFDGGTNHVVNIPSTFFNFIKNGFTYTLWMYPTQTNQEQLAGTSNTLVPKFLRDSNGKINLLLSTTSYSDGSPPLTNYSVISESAVADNQWTFVVGLWNQASKRLSLYVNGKKQEPTVTTLSYIYCCANNVTIGGDWDTGWFKGNIDEVAIYNQALTFSQIQQLYARGLVKHDLALQGLTLMPIR